MSATNRGAARVFNDFYSTPEYTTQSLLKYIKWDKVNSFLEPCKGSGAIYNKVLAIKPDQVIEYCEISEGIDYFSYKPQFKFDLIITNPPFSLAQEFLDKSLQEADCVCYLLRLNFLGSKKRKPFFDRIGTPNKLLVLSKRPSFTNNGTDATEYCFMCWDKNNIINLKEGIHII